jgi:hypothetical protein
MAKRGQLRGGEESFRAWFLSIVANGGPDGAPDELVARDPNGRAA